MSSLTVERAEQLIRSLTEGLVNIKDETGEFLMTIPDGTVIDTKGWQGWEWTHGIALTGLYHHAALTPSTSAASFSLQTALAWFRLQNKLSAGKGAPKNINTMSPFYSLACMIDDGLIVDEQGKVDEKEKEVYKAWVDEWAEWIMNELPRTEMGGFQHITYLEVNKDQLWDDTLMMSVIPLAKIGILLDRPHYVDEAKYQFMLHIQYLMDTVTGLWFHGWEFTPSKSTSGHNFARALWARGNCWITISIPLFIELLEEDAKKRGVDFGESDPLRRFLVGTFKKQVDALLRTQEGKTGMWNTLLVDRESYLESSATAGFAAGIFMGLRMGLISGDHYLQSANAALQGVINCIRPDGQLDHVSFGTGMGHDEDHYRNIPITPMPYGPALASLALIEWERWQIEHGKPLSNVIANEVCLDFKRYPHLYW